MPFHCPITCKLCSWPLPLRPTIFLVGLSVGFSGKPLPWHVLWGISLCNAAGCWIATLTGVEGGSYIFGGGTTTTSSSTGGHSATPFTKDMDKNDSTTSHNNKSLQYLLSSIAFGYLAYQEYREQYQQQQKQQQQAPNEPQKTKQPASLQLALPMTLNNLAGGVTGGVMGLSASLNALYALVVSVAFMSIGYGLGHTQSRRTRRRQQRQRQESEAQECNQPQYPKTSATGPITNRRHQSSDDNNHSQNNKHNEYATTDDASFDMSKISIVLYLILSVQSLYEAGAIIAAS
ncbi:hypothetical protein ACA910_019351 [Epithemia clementina (nom. ined.)]